jgi:hypothetical protein
MARLYVLAYATAHDGRRLLEVELGQDSRIDAEHEPLFAAVRLETLLDEAGRQLRRKALDMTDAA